MLENDPLTENEFSEILGRAALGDSEAQVVICQQYERQVRIVARILLGPQLRLHLDSMDLLQSVHRSLLIGIRSEKFSIESSDKLVALACTIVRRKVARKWRTLRRQLKHQSSPSGNVVYLTNMLSAISNPHTGPVEIAQFNDQLERLCESLHEIERKMLEMRLEGYTSGEVAERLGIHPVAIRVRWTRLRKRLQESGIFSDWL
ncbi:MAG: sigma-70 family RNA polymerase sigma factor [Planctomycetales bacterium]|nr:sigma-70 family RNA polymerase sigma factor [Planctomycetales bacterium]